MVEDAWADSYFSIVRHTGRARINGTDFYVVDKFGRTLFETSIPPGAPADLINAKFIKLYKRFGRDLFIKALEKNPKIDYVCDMREALATELGDKNGKQASIWK
jgi:hypothetical protein